MYCTIFCWQNIIILYYFLMPQDMLALQIIELCKNVFHSVGLTLYLVPYRVVATNPGVCIYVYQLLATYLHVCDVQCGVIECVPDCKSRDQLGKLTRGSLNDYFHDKFGHGDSQDYQKVKHYHKLSIHTQICVTQVDKQITLLKIIITFTYVHVFYRLEPTLCTAWQLILQ